MIARTTVRDEKIDGITGILIFVRSWSPEWKARAVLASEGCPGDATSSQVPSGGPLPFADSLARPFITALLLTGNAREAEAAVMESIGRVDLKKSGDLLRRTIAASISRHTADFGAGESDDRMPPELRRVLRLPWISRRCYVLRVLVGWPADECGGLLGMAGSELDQEASQAAVLLAAALNEQAETDRWQPDG